MNLPSNDRFGSLAAADTVRIERLLPGPIERVWAYLTESEQRGRWLATGAMDLRVGGAVELLFANDELTRDDDPPPPKYASDGCEGRQIGRITAIDPPRLLSYSWDAAGPAPSEVSFELSPLGDQVQLIVTHRRLPDREQIVSVAGGWHAHLGILVALLSDQPPEGFWRSHTRLEAEYERRIPQG